MFCSNLSGRCSPQKQSSDDKDKTLPRIHDTVNDKDGDNPISQVSLLMHFVLKIVGQFYADEKVDMSVPVIPRSTRIRFRPNPTRCTFRYEVISFDETTKAHKTAYGVGAVISVEPEVFVKLNRIVWRLPEEKILMNGKWPGDLNTFAAVSVR